MILLTTCSKIRRFAFQIHTQFSLVERQQSPPPRLTPMMLAIKSNPQIIQLLYFVARVKAASGNWSAFPIGLSYLSLEPSFERKNKPILVV